MRMSMKYAALAVALVVSVSAPRAQQVVVSTTTTAGGDATQFPMAGRQTKTGTGQIRGRVLAAETGNPIRRAQVRISGPEIMPKGALTDADGRFEFRDLPAGRFTLSATKSGYVNVQYGQTRPFESGRPIELADKQALDNADIMMPRGSVIAGRIVDEFGEPVPDVSVSALRQSWTGGRRRLTPAPGRIAQTNDLGQFRLYGLPPGEYYVSATLRNAGSEFAGFEMFAAEAGARLAAISAAGPSGSTPTSGYAPTYFPGTPSASDAQKVTLIAGQENSSVDFSLVPVRLAKISGIVVGSDGKPASGAMINLTPASRNEFMFGMPGSARTNQDGAFTISSVAPGEYMLQANSMQITTTNTDGGNMVMIRTFGAGGAENAESGSLPVSVAGDDISNLVLVTSKGGSASGRVTFEDGAKPSTITGIRVSAAPAEMDGPIGFGGAAGGLKPDGAFELKGLAGTRLIRVVNVPPGWMLKSVRFNGTDVTDTGIEFRSGEAVSGIEVVLTARTTTVTGTATGSGGSPLKDYTVVIFADNPELWRMPNTRWVSGRRPDQEGRFKFENLPPGTYHAVAVDYIPSGEWNDPEVLERLKGKGRRFTLGEGGSETLDLKLASGY
jgi:protocatechuate 3,4-dioxygenase beta subunit